jgi:hypothetical protein
VEGQGIGEEQNRSKSIKPKPIFYKEEEKMKNFFKKLSFVLAVAMVLTSLTPAVASAASKNFVTLKGNSSKAVTSVYAWIGGVTRNLDYNIGGKTSGVKGTWKSNNTKVVKVNASTGVLTPVANGTTTVTFTPSNGKNAVKTTVKVRTRAAALHIYDKAEYATGVKNPLEEKEGVTPSAIEMKVGDTLDLKVTMPLSKKQQDAGAKIASYFTYAEVDDNAVVEAALDPESNQRGYTLTAKAVGETTVTIVANQTTQANVRNGKYFREGKITVKVVDAFSAKQTGANKITITGSNLTNTLSDYVIKRGSTAINMAEVSLNEAKTEAVLTSASTSLTAGTYTATVGDKSAEFTVETSVIDSIEVIGDALVLDKAYPCESGTIEYVVYNQFGEDITRRTSNMNASTTFGSGATVNNGKGIIEVTGINNAYVLGATGTVVIVNTTTGKSVTKTITLSNVAKADTFEVLGVYNKVSGKPLSLSENADNKNAAVLVAVKDQYGRSMDQINTTTEVAINFAPGMTGLAVDTNADYTEVVTIDDKDYVAVDIDTTGTVKAGSATLVLVSKSTGKNVNYTVEVTNTKSVQSFDVFTLDNVYANEDNEFGYVALAADGTEIKDYKTLSNANYGVVLPNDGKWNWKLNSDGTASLIFNSKRDLAEGQSSTTESASFQIPSSFQYKTITFTIQESKRPASLGKTGVYTPTENPIYGKVLGVMPGEAVSFSAVNVIVYDQHGRQINPAEYANYGAYSVTVTPATTNNAELAFGTSSPAALKLDGTGNVTFTASGALSRLVSNRYTLTLVGKDGKAISGAEAQITVVAADEADLTDFKVTTKEMLYSKGGAYEKEDISVTATASNGKTVVVPADRYTVQGTVATNGGVSSAATYLSGAILDGALTSAKVESMKTTVSVIFKGIEKKLELTVSNAAPKITAASYNYGSVSASAIDVANLLNTVTTFDQYGHVNSAAKAGTITNINVIESVSTNGKVTKNNTATPTFTGFVAGDKITVSYTWGSGTTVTATYTLK